MRKILFILLLAPFALKSQTVNTFRDSTWFKRGVRFDSTLVFSKGAGVGKVWTSNANGTGSWQTFSSAGVTQGALDDSISAVRAIRKVDTIYKNLDSIIFKINEIRYSVLDSTGGGVQTLSISGDTLSISGGNSVVLPVYVQVDSATVTSYDVLNSQNAPPLSPNVGDVYLVGNTPSGAWVGHAKDIAEWNGSAWVFTDGVQGDFLYNATTALTYIFRSGNWVQTTGIPALNKGNTISTGLTIGTLNNKDFNFISNNILRGGMLANGSFRVANQGGSGNVLVGANSLGVQRKLYIGDGLSLSNDSLLASGGGGSFIPLSGTASGSPVTGDVEFYNAGEDVTKYLKFNTASGGFIFGEENEFVSPNQLYLFNGTYFLSISTGNERLEIASNNPNSTGMGSTSDFTANITDLDYTQKKYVDSRISDTAAQIRSEMPDVSNFATITNLADTSTALRSLISAKVSTTTLTDSLAKKTNKLISFNTYTTSDTLRLSDADKVIEMNVGTANNLVIPNYSDYAFPVGTQITLIQIGAGQTTLVPASGVTVRSASSKRKLSGQYSGATLIEKAPNEWYLFGDITN